MRNWHMRFDVAKVTLQNFNKIEVHAEKMCKPSVHFLPLESQRSNWKSKWNSLAIQVENKTKSRLA